MIYDIIERKHRNVNINIVFEKQTYHLRFMLYLEYVLKVK